MEENQIVEIKFDEINIEYTIRTHDMTRNQKLMLLGRLQEIQQDILDDLY